MRVLDLPDLLERAGINVRTLPGWDEPADPGYYYREEPHADTHKSEPAGHMHHHTASGHYTPNRDKANGYAGLSYNGSEALYQERYNEGMYVPVYTVANAFPAPISSGAGDYHVLQLVRAGVEPEGRGGPDTPDWYGNTHYWNTEWVCKGNGSHVDPATWEMMVVVCQVQNELMEWTRANHLGHGHHTRRKIDLWSGPYDDFIETVDALRDAMEAGMGMTTEQWARTLRNPIDFDRMAVKGVITEAERDYWVTITPDNPEMQDLRNAVDVRNPLWTD